MANKQEAPSKFNPYTYAIKNDPNESQKFSQDTEYKDLLTEEEQMIVSDLKVENQKKLNDFDEFLSKQYMELDYKINRCLLKNCYQSPNVDRASYNECLRKCNTGSKKTDTFISTQIERLQTAFQDCITKAADPQRDVMKEVVECYDVYLNTFDSLKKEIAKEFSYYE